MPGGKVYEFKDDEYPFGRDGALPRAGRETQAAYAATSERRLDVPAEDPQKPDLTGRYFHDAGKGIPSHYVHINQAGLHLQVLVVPGMSGRGEEVARRGSHASRTVHLLGDLVDDAATLYHFNDWSVKAGQLDVLKGKVTLSRFVSAEEAEELPLTKLNDAPTLFPHAMGSVPAWAKAQEWYPVLEGQLAKFVHELKRILDFHLEKFFAIEDEFSMSEIKPMVARRERIELLDANLGKLFSPEGENTYAIHDEDLPQYRRIAEEWLHAARVTFDEDLGEQTYAFYLRRAMTIAVKDGWLTPRVGELRKNLGMSLTERRRFDARIEIGGATIPTPLWWLGGKVYGGFLHLESRRADQDESEEPEWRAIYTIGFVGIAAGKSWGENGEVVVSTGKGYSDYDWQPSEVAGWFGLGDGSVGASAGYGKSYGTTSMVIQGADSVPRPLILDLSGWADKFAAGAGGEVSASVGYIFAETVTKKPRPAPHEIKAREPVNDDLGPLAGAVHFELGSAVVTDDGRRLLRILAALELPAFMDRKHTRLAIVAHTDRVDTWSRNLELAYYRAQNVRRTLDAILGKKLKIAQGNPKAGWLSATVDGKALEWTGQLAMTNLLLRWEGEREAAAAGEPDRKENQRYRRVDVILNNRLVLRLDGGGS